MQGRMNLGIEAEQERLLGSHKALLVERAGINDGARSSLTAQHHQEIAHYGRSPLRVEVDDLPTR
jgi:hypothetical protein